MLVKMPGRIIGKITGNTRSSSSIVVAAAAVVAGVEVRVVVVD